MIVDFQHHYIPEKLVRKKGLYSEKVTFVEEEGLRRVTVHPKLFDYEDQLRDMDQAGVDVSVLSSPMGWDGPLETLEEVETRLGCDGCLTAVESAAFVDRAAGDFHLTAESACCTATGAAIVAGEDPPADYEGIPWADPPSVGPYQYRD